MFWFQLRHYHMDCLEVCCFVSKCLEIFPVTILLLVSNFIPSWFEAMYFMIYILLLPSIWSLSKYVFHLKRRCISLVGGVLWKYQFYLFIFYIDILVKSSVSLLILCYCAVGFCFTYFAVLFVAYALRIAVSSWRIGFFKHMYMSFSSSGNFLWY